MITAQDIREHYVLPSIAGEFEGDFDVDAIMDELLGRFPLAEWTRRFGRYEHRALDPETGDPGLYWRIVRAHVNDAGEHW